MSFTNLIKSVLIFTIMALAVKNDIDNRLFDLSAILNVSFYIGKVQQVALYGVKHSASCFKIILSI